MPILNGGKNIEHFSRYEKYRYEGAKDKESEEALQ